MQLPDIIKQLSSTARLVPAEEVESAVPCRSGLYAIFVDRADSLPSPFSEYLKQRGTRMIYLGKASGNLQTRLVKQDLRHKQASTFFRGIGALLGYVPPTGSLRRHKNQTNYKFSPADTQLIIGWINRHLSLRCVAMTRADVELSEALAISALRPLLNWTHNPDRLQELHDLREACRRIAK